MKKFLIYIQLMMAVLTAASCSDDLMSMEQSMAEQNIVTLSANSSRLITKAGLQSTDFDLYTKYIIYCIESGSPYDWNKGVMYDREAWENQQHLIEYGKDIFFDGKTLDFYGATLCSTRGLPYNVNNIGGTPGSPVIGFSLADYGVSFPDLMYSNNLKGCTARMGLLEMNFTHALSKVQVEISRQDDADLEGITLQSVSLVHCSADGKLDILSGEWSDVDTDAELFISEQETVVTDKPEMLKEGTDDAYALIIPNETSKDLISLHIHLTTANGQQKEFTYPLYASPTIAADDELSDPEPFIFEQNHRYVLSVILLDEGVRVLAVSPQAYDWIDVSVDTYMGQPVNFGGLMWMDRNLGAESADCENDWEKTRGFYYQYGRNIPYIFDQEKFRNRNSSKNLFRTWIDSNQLDIGYEYFYTYNEKGERVYGAVQGGTLSYHYSYHVSELNVSGVKQGWSNDGTGWVWNGSRLIDYVAGATPKFLSSNGAFDYGGFWTATQVGYGGTTSNNITEDAGAPQWQGPSVTTSNIAVNPGDPGVYNFIFDARYYTDYLQSGAWCVMDCQDPWNWNHWRNLSIDEWNSSYSGWDSGSSYPSYKGWLLNHGCRDTRTEDTEKVNYYWVDINGNPIPENHPCPKGWRIPTKEDFAGIFPDHNIDNSWASEDDPKMFVMPGTYGDMITEYQEAAVYGIDHLGRKVIYLIKRKGEKVCYRLRLLWKDSNLTRDSYYGLSSGSDYPMQYLEISRYPGSGEMSFDKYYNSEVGTQTITNSGGLGSIDGININKDVRIMTGWELYDLGFYDDFDWDSATEVMQFPICGFIYPGQGQDGMFYDGKMTILRCTDWYKNYDLVKSLRPVEEGGSDATYTEGAYPYNEAMNWCAYIRTDRNTGMFSGSRKTLGDQIRCVRDINAK